MKKEKHKIGDKVLLVWLDAFGRGSWNGTADVEQGLKEYITVEIIGFLVKEDAKFYVLAMGIQNDPYSKPFLHLEFIPKGSVVGIKKIN